MCMPKPRQLREFKVLSANRTHTLPPDFLKLTSVILGICPSSSRLLFNHRGSGVPPVSYTHLTLPTKA